MDSIPPSLPLRVAQAYGQPVGSRGVPGEAIPNRAGTPGAKSRTLVAAKVERPLTAATVAKELSTPSRPSDASTGALQMYRHPADRNAAATSILVGRKLDVTA